jgi:hypothetical protein
MEWSSASAPIYGTLCVVALKVRRAAPEPAELLIWHSCRTLKSFCRLAMPQHVSAFNEIEKQFVTEFDYRGEASNLERVRSAVRPHLQAVRFAIPSLGIGSGQFCQEKK